MLAYTLSSVGSIVKWKERIKSLLISGILFVSMYVNIKVKRISKLMWIKRNGITLRLHACQKPHIVCILQLIDYCYPTWKWGCRREKKKGHVICYNIAFVVARMSHVGIWGHYMNLLQCQKLARNIGVITLDGQL